jgi:hypothetical protein
MAANHLSKEQAQEAVEALEKYGTKVAAATALGIPRSTLCSRLESAERLSGRFETPGAVSPEQFLSTIKKLEAQVKASKEDALDHATIKQKIIQLAQETANLTPPAWTVEADVSHDFPGVPTLFVSDIHHGEVVHPTQINGVNRFDMAICAERFKRLAESTIRLLSILSPSMKYPGIVMPFGGDMISGNIHDELMVTNEFNTMPTILDLFEILGSLIRTMADTFGNVFIPCVTGNHGRDTRKIYAKDRHHTSFDWLLFCFLQKHFAADKRITFLIPDGPDAYYKIYRHRYLLTHGDQFRGGDSMIGPLGPIIRGDHKKRSRNVQIDLDYDTLIMGHWHQYIHLTRLIVNGSLKGYDEYAYANNFPFEPPQQALWLTHPKYRITYRMPVYVDRLRNEPKSAWVSLAAPGR